MIDGGSGITNSLDFSAYTTAVTVDLRTGEATETKEATPKETTLITEFTNINRVVGKKDLLNLFGGNKEATVSYSDDDGIVGNLLEYVGLNNIEGTPGDDHLIGNDGINVIVGKSGDDRLEGKGGVDMYMFSDGWGADTIVELNGVDGGFDILDFTQVTADLTFTIHADGTVSVTDGTNRVFAADNIEWLIDGQGNDTYVFEDGATFSGTIGKANWLQKLLGVSQPPFWRLAIPPSPRATGSSPCGELPRWTTAPTPSISPPTPLRCMWIWG